MKMIRLLTSVEDTIFCGPKFGSDISSNTSCAWRREKNLAPPPPTSKIKIFLAGVGGLYRQGRVISPGSWPEPGLKLDGAPRGQPWSFSPGSGHEPGLMTRAEPGPMPRGARRGSNRDQCLPLVPVFSEPGLMGFLAPDERVVFH